jgi:hypothetical protein
MQAMAIVTVPTARTSPSRAWSRLAWAITIWLSAGGLTAMPIAFFGSVGPPRVGCGGGIGILFVVLLGLALIWAVIALLAAGGAALLWFRSRWGTFVLIPVNLFSVYVVSSATVKPGQLLWGIQVILMTLIPVAAVALLAWALWTRGRLWVRLLEVAILGAVAVPVVLYAAPMLAGVAGSAIQAPAAQPVAHAGCGGSAMGPAAHRS